MGRSEPPIETTADRLDELAKELQRQSRRYEELAALMREKNFSTLSIGLWATYAAGAKNIERHIGAGFEAYSDRVNGRRIIDKNHPVAKQIEAAQTAEEKAAAQQAFNDLVESEVDNIENQRRRNKRKKKP